MTYTIDNELVIPDKVWFEIRLPTEFAISKETYRFLPEIEQNVMRYLNEKLEYNTNNPWEGFSLDMSISEVIWVQSNIEHLRDMARSGEL